MLFLFALTFITFVYAQPPFSEPITGTPGYNLNSIEPPQLHANGTDYSLHFHITNNTDGKLINATTNIVCFYHLQNPQGTDIFDGYLTRDVTSTLNTSLEAKIKSNNFTSFGLYNILAQCVDSSGVTGNPTRLILENSYGTTSASTPLILWYLGALAFFVFLTILLFIAYGKLPQDNDRDEEGELLSISKLKYFRYIIILSVYWIFVAMMFIISTTARYYLNDTLITKLFFALFTILMRMSLPFIFVIFIYIILEIFEDRRLKDLWERGLPAR